MASRALESDEDRSSNLRKLRSRPVCIICGRPAEALEIAKVFGISRNQNRLHGHQVQKIKDGHTFFLGEFTLAGGEKLKYYITSSLRQGVQSFTVAAALLFNTLNPRFVVHAGVCAGYDDPQGKVKLQLRDVVFGEAAINYEEGKWEVPVGGASTDIVFRPDYNRVTVEAGDMQAFAEAKDKPRYHYGEYISGSAVRNDAGDIFQKIRASVNRNAIALDMEASAFLQLCNYLTPRGPVCLGVVKGVSDFGNSDKGKDEDAYSKALQNTAAALQDWITYQIPEVDWEVDESGEPGAKLVAGYYNNFVRRVLDNHSDGMRAQYRDSEDTIPIEEVKGLKSVLPKGRQPWFVKELGQVQDAIRSYGIAEIRIGSEAARRPLWYKDGYFIDWCRTVNSLEGTEDPVYQVGVFKRFLEKQSYYRGAQPLAQVVSWEDTMAWLSASKQGEAESAVAGPAAPVQDVGENPLPTPESSPKDTSMDALPTRPQGRADGGRLTL